MEARKCAKNRTAGLPSTEYNLSGGLSRIIEMTTLKGQSQ